jgi:hypothetical protein
VDRYALRIGIAFLLYLGTCWGGPLPSIAVGTSKPNLQSYSTIQDAVGNVAAGGTILVCAGAYPEQVLITKPLTMKGVLSGTAGQLPLIPLFAPSTDRSEISTGPAVLCTST